MNKRLLYFFRDLGLLEALPDIPPAKGTVLARSVCFLHDGADNPRAFLLYADGYACTTYGCHKTREFGHNLEGLIRQLVKRATGRTLNWLDAWAYARRNVAALKALIPDNVEPGTARTARRPSFKWTKEELFECLRIPAEFYLKRGYKPETLEHFGVGTCVRTLPDEKNLLGWSIIPVLDYKNLPPLGYTARNPKWYKDCKVPKWIHAVKRSECLFNYGGALLGNRKHLIVSEGPGCVMRFWEAGYRGAVATMGASLSEQQYFQLMNLYYCGQTLYIAADADEVGRKFAEQLKNKLKGIADPVVIYPPYGKDFGDMATDQIGGMGICL